MSVREISLRQWVANDLERFAEMNADPEVMRFFPKPLHRDESREIMNRFRQHIDEQGWGLWAVEVDGLFAGFTGMYKPLWESHFTPCVEIGWRFRREYWGQSIAYGAARQAERFAFEALKLDEVVSFTTVGNVRSRRLMERLGFTRNPQDDFWHPSLPAEHPLAAHVLYRKAAGEEKR